MMAIWELSLKLKSRKAIVSEMVSWALAVLILTFAFVLIIIVTVFNIVPNPKINIEGLSTSSVCNHDLLNLLRANPPEDRSVTFAELAGMSQTDSAIQTKFKTYVENYLEKNLWRGDTGKRGWKLQLLDEEYVPLMSTGTLQDAAVSNSCSQTIPNYEGGVLTARFGLAY
ncbi:MAG: hypothetical protein HY438_02785 [DPANN group archaeon]|nr:hypothetical protein [DPANN group archaeon]